MEIRPFAETLSLFPFFFMDHIFGDSHDIAFGANPAPARPTRPAPTHDTEQPKRKVHHDDFGDLDPVTADRPARVAPRAPIIREPRAIKAETATKPVSPAPRPHVRERHE